MPEAVGTTIDSGGSVSQPPSNVSLDTAISYINDFAANAQMVEGMFSLILAVASSVGSQIAHNNARMNGIERNLISISQAVARLDQDDLHRPIGSGGGNRSSTAPTSAQFSGE